MSDVSRVKYEYETQRLNKLLAEKQIDLDYHIRESASLRQGILKLQQERWEYEKGMADALGQLAEANRILEWYASEVNWIQGRYEGGVFFTVAEDDKGKRARDFLAKHDGYI